MQRPPDISVLRGTQVELRPMHKSFVTSTYHGWLTDPDVSRFIAMINCTFDELTRYVDERVGNPNVRFWAICNLKTDAHIGNVKLEPIHWKLGRATFGILIGDRASWGKGICTEVTELVTRHAFDDLGLLKVDLGVSTDNIAAIKAYQKAGYHTEGRIRRYTLLRDQVQDALLMARFADGSTE